MKKFFLVVVLALTTLTINAQEKIFLEYGAAEEEVEKVYRDKNFAIKLGAGISNLLGTEAYPTTSYKFAFSYDWRLVKGLYLIPEMDFIVKGSNPWNWTNTLNTAYLQMPVCLAWKFDLPKGMKLGLKVGPYVAVGLFGSDIIWDSWYTSDVFDSNFGSSRFDAGVMAGVHFDFFVFTVGMEYSQGLIMLNSGYTPLNGYNYAAGMTFGVRF